MSRINLLVVLVIILVIVSFTNTYLSFRERGNQIDYQDLIKQTTIDLDNK